MFVTVQLNARAALTPSVATLRRTTETEFVFLPTEVAHGLPQPGVVLLGTLPGCHTDNLPRVRRPELALNVTQYALHLFFIGFV